METKETLDEILLTIDIPETEPRERALILLPARNLLGAVLCYKKAKNAAENTNTALELLRNGMANYRGYCNI